MRSIFRLFIVGCFLVRAASASADATFGVDPTAPWLGFMNVFEIPSHGGGYVFGSGWGIPDLTATFSGSVLTLGPNSVNDPNPFWYMPSGGPGSMGNKTMDANIYQEQTDTLMGQHVTFTGTVLSNTLVSPYTTVAFVKDFSANYSSFFSSTVALTPGVFSVSLDTVPLPGRHVQFGFETIGPDVWSTDRGPVGTAVVTTAPGDFNQNGKLDGGDVNAMLNALTDLPAFASAHSLTTAQLDFLGDSDGDGKFTNLDIQPWLDIFGAQLPVGGGAITPVPEPATSVLLAIGALCLWRRKPRELRRFSKNNLHSLNSRP